MDALIFRRSFVCFEFMQISFFTIIGIVVPVFCIMAAGFALRRLRLLSAEADHSLMQLVVKLLYPCLILDSMIGNPALKQHDNVVLPPLIGFGLVMIAFAVCFSAARLAKLGDQRRKRSFCFVCGIQNYGYIALPIVAQLFSKETLGVLFTHNLGVDIAFWTVGLVILAGTSLRDSWRQLLNGPAIAIVAALLLNLFHAGEWLPTFVRTVFHMLGVSAIPLALILVGAIFSDLFKSFRPGKVSVCAVLCRLMVMPVIFLIVAKFLPLTTELKQVLIVQGAMPAGMFALVMTRHYKGDTEAGLETILTTSLCGLITIPFWITLGLHWVF